MAKTTKKIFRRESLQKYQITAKREVPSEDGEWTFLVRPMTRAEYKRFLRMLQESNIERDEEGNVLAISPEQVEQGLAVVDFGLSTCVVDEVGNPVFPNAEGIDQLGIPDTNALFQAIMAASNPKEANDED